MFDECLLTVVFEELGSHLEIENVKEFITDFPFFAKKEILKNFFYLFFWVFIYFILRCFQTGLKF